MEAELLYSGFFQELSFQGNYCDSWKVIEEKFKIKIGEKRN